MLPFNALQISLSSIHFDRHTDFSMFGYVVGLAQRNIDGPGQLYLSPGSFRVRRDGKAATKTDAVHVWDGDGEIIFSTPTQGLERVSLDLYFVRDRARIRDFGHVLRELFAADEVGADLAKLLSSAIAKSNPATGAVVELLPKAARFVGRMLESQRDRVKIRAEGSLKMSTILEDNTTGGDADNTRLWGRSRADRGFFTTEWNLVTTDDPQRRVIPAELPEQLMTRFS